MSGYLPLCAFRQGLLFETCRTCAWWQTSAGTALGAAPQLRSSPREASDSRRRWMTSVEDTWGGAGLLLEGGSSRSGAVPSARGPADGAPGPTILGSIHFAPAAQVPRLRDFSFGALPGGSALVFCLACADDQPRYQPGRLLHGALAKLKERGVQQVFGVAAAEAACRPVDADRCRFFALEFLEANGFQPVGESSGLILMRIDLDGILSVFSRAKSAVKEMFRNDPAPSPAAWSSREAG